MTPEIDPRMQTWLDDDAAVAEKETAQVDVDSLWGTLEEELDDQGFRDTLVSQPTPVRMGLGAAIILVVGVVGGAVQGVRGDLDGAGWTQFAIIGGIMLILAGIVTLWPLRSRASAPRPMWPLVPVAWLGVTLFSLVPWPGVHGIPPKYHLMCFGFTSAIALATALVLWGFDRSRALLPGRLGVLVAGAAMGAYVFQGLHCPGVDVAHLLIGHGGPAIGLSLIVAGLATLLRR